MRRAVRRAWRKAMTEARWLRDRYFPSELDPYFQGPDPIEPDVHSVRVDPEFRSWRELAWEARFAEVAYETPQADIDDFLAEIDPKFASWLRQERRS
ncbi:hypothetical protein [Streptodolium elevatio]|uniref:Uncharacterized protein n=1 Tax=Streptodolium elevatio TaxID=3157996 RepID=A0ABV3DJV9_9ACTN